MKNLFRTNHKFIAAVAVLGLSFSPLHAGSSARGTTSASFLTLGVDARALALGEAQAASAKGASALYWNPAALMQQSNSSALTFMHAPYLESTFFDYLAFSRAGSKGAFGASAQYFSAGDIDRTDINGVSSGNFSPSDTALTFGGARKFSKLSLGGSVKYIKSKITKSATTVAVDAGLLYPITPKAKAAVTVSNMGPGLKYDQESAPLPLALRLGGSYQLTQRAALMADVGIPKDDDPFLALGAETVMPLGKSWTGAARIGLNTRTLDSVDGFSGGSVGFGLTHGSLGFDYAFVPVGTLGLTHRFSVSLAMGAKPSSEKTTLNKPADVEPTQTSKLPPATTPNPTTPKKK